MKEGDVVMVVGKSDDRVRKRSLDPIFGTIYLFLGEKKNCWIILPDGEIWIGPIYETVKN